MYLHGSYISKRSTSEYFRLTDQPAVEIKTHPFVCGLGEVDFICFIIYRINNRIVCEAKYYVVCTESQKITLDIWRRIVVGYVVHNGEIRRVYFHRSLQHQLFGFLSAVFKNNPRAETAVYG